MKTLISVLIILFSSMPIFPQQSVDGKLKNLVLRAKVLETKIDKSDEKYPRCSLKLEVTFTNEGNEPIIILQPRENADFMFSCGLRIYGRARYGDYLIQNNCALLSVCRRCNENLAKLLDQKLPPEIYTKTLKPNESFSLKEEEVFGMPLKTSSGMYGWNEIAENNWKVDGSITYSMFPINLGKYGEYFGYKLQKRWEKYGVLYVGGTHSLISSGKFEIDLSNLKF